MKMQHADLLKAVGVRLTAWQGEAVTAGCELTQVNVVFPDSSTVVFYWLEAEGVWDADTGKANTEGVGVLAG